MNANQRIIILFTLLLTLGSCKSYRYFSIDIYEPAEISLPSRIERVLITHNAHPSVADSKGTAYNVFDEIIYDTVYRDTSLARAAIFNLTDMLNLTGSVDAVPLDSITQPFPVNPEDFTLDDVMRMKTICDTNRTDACILLSKIESKFDYNFYYGDFMSVFGEMMVIMKTKWLLIDPYRAKLIDMHDIKDTLYFRTDEPFVDDGPDRFAKTVEMQREAAIESAIQYGTRISPHLVESSRMIFKSGNKYIRRGYKQAVEGNWKNAAAFWREGLAAPELKNKAKACFNLALASEMEGLLKPALQWAEKSYKFFPDKVNQTYIDILKERLKQQEKLLEQMK